MTSINTSWKQINSFNSASGVETVKTYARVTSQNVVNNTTTVQYSVRTFCSGSASAYGTVFRSLDQTEDKGYYVWSTSEQEVMNFSKTYTHDNSGDKSVSGTTSFTSNVSSMSGSGSWTIELPHINRYATINSFNVGGSYSSDMSVRYTKHNASFYNRMRVSIPNVQRFFYLENYVSGTVFNLHEHTYGGYPVDEWIERHVTNKKTVIIEVVVETWTSSSACTAGGTPNIGESVKTAKFSIGSEPNVSGFTVTETNLSEEITVRDMSQKYLSVVVTANTYASVSSVKVTAGGCTSTLTANGNTYTGYITGMVNQSDTITYTLTATDSRGYTSTAEVNQQYYEYSVPSIESCTVTRIANPSGVDPTTPNTADALCRVAFTVHFTPILGNTVTVSASGVGSSTATATSLTGGTFEGSVDLQNADYRNSYNVTAVFTDALGGSSSVTLNLPKSIPTLSVFDDEVDVNGKLATDTFWSGGHYHMFGNVIGMCGGMVYKSVSGTSTVIVSHSTIRTAIGISDLSEQKTCVIVANANGSINNIHVEGTTYLNGNWYVTFPSTASGNATFTWFAFAFED